MTKITLELDTAVVMKAIHAQVEPAGSAVLASYDIRALVEAELRKKRSSPGHFQSMLYMMEGGPERPTIDVLIDNAIRDVATAHVKKLVARERPKIEEAFRAEVKASSSRIAKTMFDAFDGAMKDAWSFELVTTAKAKEPERD